VCLPALTAYALILYPAMQDGVRAQVVTVPLEFEVTSVKPRVGMLTIGGSSAGTRFHRPDINLRQLIQFAYDLPPFRVVGGPKWIETERWEIDGRMVVPVSTEQMRPPVQRLLAERFRLKARLESRALPVFFVRIANKEGRLGDGLRPSILDCTSVVVTSADTPAPVDSNGFPLCTGMTVQRTSTYQSITIRGTPLPTILQRLEATVRQSLVDRTELKGNFDLQLTFSLTQPTVVTSATDAPAIGTAFQEQLGLNLEPGRDALNVLVIESVERPQPN
jgi:uncharacterized protein (TIGR03435 family)